MRNKILIVDDVEIDRELIIQAFENDYGILTAEDGRGAVRQIEKYHDELAVILLDLVMPVMDGYQVLKHLRAVNMAEKIPVILVTVNTDINLAVRCYSLGIADIINKPFNTRIVRHRVLNIIEIYRSRERLEEQLNESQQRLTEREQQLQNSYDNLIDAISNIVEFRDLESGTHIKRVKGLTRIMAETYQRLYPEDGMETEQLNNIVMASALHDIGKIAIPDNILLKPGRLTSDEMTVMKGHTTRGCDILSELENVQDSEHYKAAYEIVRHHHERYDGKGYPDGLRGEDIPLSAQLVSIVDVYDALVSERVYKKAYSKDEAYDMIMEGRCGVFSPKMLRCLEEARQVIENYSDTN